MLGGKSGWDNGPELGGATYWSVWCKTPLTMDDLKFGPPHRSNFQDNISDRELREFNQWLKEDPYEELDSSFRLESRRMEYRPVRKISDR